MRIKKNKGYSVIEIIIYLAIFAFLSVTVINSFIVVLGSFNITRTNRDLLESGSTAMERISKEIRQAYDVDTVNSIFLSTPGSLQLNSTNSSGTASVIKFSVSSNALNMYQDGVLVGNLLGQNISPTNLVFRRIVTTNGEAIKIELTLQDTRNKDHPSASFYDTVILRGEY